MLESSHFTMGTLVPVAVADAAFSGAAFSGAAFSGAAIIIPPFNLIRYAYLLLHFDDPVLSLFGLGRHCGQGRLKPYACRLLFSGPLLLCRAGDQLATLLIEYQRLVCLGRFSSALRLL